MSIVGEEKKNKINTICHNALLNYNETKELK
jgi:hypothetical protein